MRLKKGKAVKVTVNSKEESSWDFCLDFVQEFGLWIGENVVYLPFFPANVFFDKEISLVEQHDLRKQWLFFAPIYIKRLMYKASYILVILSLEAWHSLALSYLTIIYSRKHFHLTIRLHDIHFMLFIITHDNKTLQYDLGDPNILSIFTIPISDNH